MARYCSCGATMVSDGLWWRCPNCGRIGHRKFVRDRPRGVRRRNRPDYGTA